MTRILYLITSTGIGGTERTLCEICRRLDRRRYHQTVVSLKSEGPMASRLRDLGVEVLSLEMRESADWLSAVEFALGLLRLPRLLKGHRFDILHSFLFRANLFGRLAAGRCGIPRVITSVRVTPEEERPWMQLLDRMTLKRVDLFLVLSENLSRDLQSRLNIPPEKIAVLPNGIDVSAADRALAATRPEARARLGLSPADMVVAYIGRLHRQKGLSHLIEAFRSFFQEHPRGRLLIAGNGPERKALEEQATAIRLAPQVTFLGEVSSPWEVLAAADIFVLPSVWEGMPNALLEAMAASLPVVATQVGAVAEMVEDGKGGLLVPPADPAALSTALDRLAWSMDMRQAMGCHAREKVEKQFQLEATMERLDQLYQNLLGSREEAPA